jgi:protease-4
MSLRREKPVVVSVGGMAASGGYYIASAGSKIVAERGSIVGSIGVVRGKLSVGESLDNLGVHVTVVPARADGGARAAYMSPFVSWDDATRAKLEQSMKQVYQLFLKRIAEGRGVEVGAVEPAAEGRIMGGEDAKSRGLVDELGGLSRALELARELTKSPVELPVDVVESGADWLGVLRGDEAASTASASLDAELRRRVRDALTASFGDSSPLLDDLGAFVGVTAPLMQGEHALVAPPFALVVR